jgi:hypothetical protein
MLSDQAVTNWQLRSLGAHIDDLLRQHSSRLDGAPWIRGDLRLALESSLDLLMDVAAEAGLDTPESRPILAMRDIVAIHLRAAEDVEAAEGGLDTVMRLLTRAATSVNDELTLIATTR